ncbi:helix-turn-helix transcriptional regulator [Streptomyces solicathayae]|uniref:Helix-turn-helix transcriptional regulator n=1 Tax=Streptomyces solicathayae TaxID=3081768 RepID=A0ABZ0LPW3_9ACTN|nr:helix-turn-helix transcriptional regulator [Streptomyces sp. HUAS YS2]WOX21552.1 helix-turn-helix transcriptional regulator [Streptomyces sp. HUAS YS2]
MDDRTELTTFLRSRRARLRPEDVGLPDYGRVRRVEGLRREELARLAGVSLAHYTRLEQGNGDGVSGEILDAVAAALRMDEDERAYLHAVARRPAPCPPAPPEVPAALRHLLESTTTTPALVVGRHTQIVGWNALAVAVFGDFPALPPDRRTLSHLLFAEPYGRALHAAGWERTAREHVASLRVLLGRYRGDAELTAHIDRMRGLDADFDRLWAEQTVARAPSRPYALHHPVVGPMTLHGERVTLPDRPACYGLDLYAAEPGSASEDALRRLAGGRRPQRGTVVLCGGGDRHTGRS